MAPLIAILLSTGVITGMLALSVDVGNLTWERRQLQNGTDAAVLALAQTCAERPADCTTDAARADLDPLLDANAADGTAQFDNRGDALCGNVPTLPACTSGGDFADLAECPPSPGWLTSAFPWVQTYSRTDSGGGNTILPSYFAQAMTGEDPETSSSACARAAWGTPGDTTHSVPILLSTCEWRAHTALGSVYPFPPSGPAPGYGGAGQPAFPSSERVIYLKGGSGETGCTYEGKDRPGGFGYAESSNCLATVSTGSWVKVDTGNSATNACRDLLAANVGKVILLPVFDCVTGSPLGGPPTSGTDCDSGNGNNTWYHLQGWSAFYLSGYRIGGSQTAGSRRNGAIPCSNPGRCLSGWFVKDTIDASDILPPGGDTDFGVIAIKMAG